MVRFIFLFSLNNSGTTIISQYLHSQIESYLPPFGMNEGQAAPTVREIMNEKRWDPSHKYDWRFIRSEWEKLALSAGKSVFIEGSPPNVVRSKDIIDEFGNDAAYIVSSASPYSFISSVIFNYNKPPLTRRKVERATHGWIEKTEHLVHLLKTHPDIPRISYESFCEDPTCVNTQLDIPLRDFCGLSGKKNDPIARIVDMSARNFSFLTQFEWEWANDVLKERLDLVSLLGYDICDGAELIRLAGAEPGQLHSGLIRRTKWECGS